ncbi:Coenzyme F420 hydrogenase/dehydrogenase, beta subunit C-terminal domain [Hyunsoonleella pacifica]|uniref:Coenzyme F420 hydrogenase n=1 Tax=Hyunsoonleella pacifica TaxID=1080224 RepID=A0A4V2JBB8_9FLAO|nr:Coenzyme F420 hydrogenase/dehydrogenase, beta subunit C-terminal domain [Hyunsoonleella pacifica]TBN18641.1 coenzyme F420 hydrogenase [Hyunsoonleella pacifica]GGD03472.1 coenzyme F420 hydrogenase [Hyunsoonleella pacifica]
MKTESQILNETVIKNGYCIGCGACAAKKDSPFEMKMDKYGNFVAESSVVNLSSNTTKVLNTCPFSNTSKNETELAKEFFPEIKKTDHKIGRFAKNFAGYVKENDFRKRGSSGGVAKWIGYQLLKNKEIDYFVQLIPNQSKDSSELLFDYGFFSDPEDVLKGSKSSYYPVTLVDVINKIANEEARYAITGVPCFIKTLRLIASEDKLLKERIKFTLGIVCGGMKSANHAKMIGWELGVNPENLISIDFRRKYKDRPASQKIYQVWSNNDAVERYRNAGEIFGTDYGSGLFKPKACDYCDDVVGELADVSIGDAWLRDYRNDPEGTSLIIVRNKKILTLLENASKEDRVKLTEITEIEAGDSQAGGFRHRRQGLSYRLKKRQENGEWAPKKRVKPGEFNIPTKRQKIYDLREQLATDSHIFFHEALMKNDLKIFKSKIGVLMNKYYKANLPPVHKRIMNKAERVLKKLKLK